MGKGLIVLTDVFIVLWKGAGCQVMPVENEYEKIVITETRNIFCYNRANECTLYSGSRPMLGHVLSVGVPTNLNILFSCSSTSLPGNNGRPLFAISVGERERERELTAGKSY